MINSILEKSKTKITLFSALLTFLLCGCATANFNTVKVKGVSADLEESLEDSKDVLNDFGFDIQEISKEYGETTITSEHPEGQKAWVEIKEIKNSKTEIKVKVNRRGGKKVEANQILEDIVVRF